MVLRFSPLQGFLFHCAAGREVYFKGEEKRLLSVVNSIFASGYLTEDGQGIEDTIRVIEDAGFTYEIESA